MACTLSCSIYIKLESICYKTTYSQEIGLINFDVLSKREKLLLTLRTQIEEIIEQDWQYIKEPTHIFSLY